MARSGKIIRPPRQAGVLLEEAPFSLEDIGALADALEEQARGRLARLQETARVVEARLKERADQAREQIEEAKRVARESIEEQIERASREAADLREGAEPRGFESGRARGFEAGYEDGLAQGLKGGREEGLARAESEFEERVVEEARIAREHAAVLAEELTAQWRGLVTSLRGELVELVLRATSRMVRGVVEECPESVLRVVEEAVDFLGQRVATEIEVNPFELEAVRSALHDREGSRCEEFFTITPAADVERGGCRVKTARTEIDAALSTQIELLREQLTGGAA